LPHRPAQESFTPLVASEPEDELEVPELEPASVPELEPLLLPASGWGQICL